MSGERAVWTSCVTNGEGKVSCEGIGLRSVGEQLIVNVNGVDTVVIVIGIRGGGTWEAEDVLTFDRTHRVGSFLGKPSLQERTGL